MATIFYDDFFKLTANPFGETPDPRFYFASKTHQNALQSLIQGIEQGKGFSLLIGEVGAGKTLVSRILLQAFSERADSALILYPCCTEGELIRSICKELEIAVETPSSDGHKQDLDRLNEFLLANAKKGRKTILLIDEAQNMPSRTLETVRLLSNLETNNQKLIHTVLCAQPEFLAMLAQDEFRQLRQRIAISVKLESFSTSETESYIKHRIECSGGSNFLRFDAEACKQIQKAAHGLPRNINRICDQLLTAARKRAIRLITQTLTKEIISSPSQARWFKRILRREENFLP